MTSGPWDKSVSQGTLPPETAKQQHPHFPFLQGIGFPPKIWGKMSHFYVKTMLAGFCIGMVTSHEFFILRHKCSRNILAWVGRDMQGTCPCHSPQLLNVGMCLKLQITFLGRALGVGLCYPSACPKRSNSSLPLSSCLSEALNCREEALLCRNMVFLPRALALIGTLAFIFLPPGTLALLRFAAPPPPTLLSFSGHFVNSELILGSVPLGILCVPLKLWCLPLSSLCR